MNKKLLFPKSLIVSGMTIFFLLTSIHAGYSQGINDGDMLTIGILLILGVLVIGVVVIASSNAVYATAMSGKKVRQIVEENEDGEETTINHIEIKKGMDILLKGESEENIEDIHTSRYALQPINYHDILPIPKIVPEDGSELLAGDPLFFDKKHPDIFFVSPVSGEMAGIVRGPKRAIHQVVVLADRDIKFRKLNSPDVETADRATIREFLKKNGGWPLFRQRPYNILPDSEGDPRDIFISTFSSAPLAGNMEVKIDGRYEAMQKGIDVLNRLTDGKVYMGMDGRQGVELPAELVRLTGVEKHYFSGPHPIGNVGIQIHHIAPIKKGDIVWTIGVQELITLGNMFLLDRYDARRVVNIAGNGAESPRYVRTYAGADLSEMVSTEFEDSSLRVISGNVLTGQKKDENPFLNFYDDQVTIIPEGDHYEMFGWLIPQTMRPSASHTFPNFLFKGMKFNVDTNTHGERRAFVMTGQYEEVLPVDTHPMHLFKAILAQDIDRMEGLGIYELVEEDVALCEFVCTSKQPIQSILRGGLDFMHLEA